ncbi:hypothetical protein GGR26_002897 [Lewinella marina]|uniref:Glucose-methanol-choline oxidoreductase C-terminal domain-containing protein n=1 Tax=Neolewinella marina TaxID=438751 RepID=A0A2G0CBL6_9BACT|nr:GMC oxidoreductase [Neolewinella marina]NJB87120.1 hypothetical protein [Neolewinella marina]PHK97352.1 hypothetical protein CGL56_16230 [Neolewinella marina]
MDRPSVCIIGCGTYGSYLLRQLRERHGDALDITVVEVGNETTRSSEEIGLATSSDTSKVSRFGRYFGLGGTSARWGGQILFFDERDIQTDDPDWNYVVELNNRHRGRVLRELLGRKKKLREKEDPRVKNGIWLGYFKRNLFKRLGKKDKAAVRWLKNSRVTGFNAAPDGTISGVEIRAVDGTDSVVEADRFYLTSGALESCRLLRKLDNGTLARTDLGKNLGDHVSVELFRVKNSPPVLHGVDFTPRFIGSSLFTKRLLVNTQGGRVNFAHVVPNKDVAAFTVLKKAMFGRQEGGASLKEVVQSFKFLALFGSKLVFRRKLHIHRNDWSLQLDIEQGDETDNEVLISQETDRFGEPGIHVKWKVSRSDRAAIAEAKKKVKQVLDAEGHRYEELFTDIHEYEKLEDTYHPVGFIRMGEDERAPVDRDFRVRGTQNLYHFSTALFRSAKSINPTGAGFCLIEEHLERAYPMSS